MISLMIEIDYVLICYEGIQGFCFLFIISSLILYSVSYILLYI